jgi:hypothetical protein
MIATGCCIGCLLALRPLTFLIQVHLFTSMGTQQVRRQTCLDESFHVQRVYWRVLVLSGAGYARLTGNLLFGSAVIFAKSL